MDSWTRESFAARLNIWERVIKDDGLAESLLKTHFVLMKTISNGGKILIFGNGGSAADAQHFAAELVCKFRKDRRALPAIALTTDSSILTAVGNDYDFDRVFERQIEALCRPEDTVIGFTTSDIDATSAHSRNIYRAFGAAGRKGARRIGFFSTKTITLLSAVDVALIVPAENTAIIQEVHKALFHIICDRIEQSL